MQHSPKAKKAAKTRAKNARFRAVNAKARETAKIHHAEIDAKRAKAYSDMEPHVGDLVSMGTLAMDQFDKDKGLFIFAVGKLEEMLNEFRQRYYAVEFPPA
jgi:hypothetical protein